MLFQVTQVFPLRPMIREIIEESKKLTIGLLPISKLKFFHASLLKLKLLQGSPFQLPYRGQLEDVYSDE